VQVAATDVWIHDAAQVANVTAEAANRIEADKLAGQRRLRSVNDLFRWDNSGRFGLSKVQPRTNFAQCLGLFDSVTKEMIAWARLSDCGVQFSGPVGNDDRRSCLWNRRRQR
jgi:hypothetical protein